MKKFVRKIFCRHKHKKPIYKETNQNGKTYRNLGRECRRCKKAWWLN